MSDQKKVCVIMGSRRGPGNQRTYLYKLIAKCELVIVGDAPGVDEEAIAVCVRNGIPYDKFHAGWEGGRADGPKRNGRMALYAAALRQSGCKVIAHAFPDSKSTGTWDCVRQLQELGFEPVIHEVGPAFPDLEPKPNQTENSLISTGASEKRAPKTKPRATHTRRRGGVE